MTDRQEIEMNPADDLEGFLRQAQEITAQMQAAGQHAAAQPVTGVTEDGGVQITMTPGGEVHGVSIQPRVVNLDNLRRLEELVAEALRDALTKTKGAATQSLAPFADSFQRLAGDDSPADRR
ncbi:YbaB/EbfC family nucleoid-associated protein [Actinoplanes sp. NPDC049265]|uniref:YbaB/EbfC family nucleoid-associated protein n=1 Tax=Actinoplanes sp. NPDC049265 TaxID=3363902 RepID=UPI00371A5FBA